MPARDGTGPVGTGPVGRRLGPCSEFEYENSHPYGMGMAHRRGRRFGNWMPRWFWRENTPNEEIQILQNRQRWLKEQMDAVSREIDNLNKTPE
jgi:hypothetical protein